MTVQFYTLRAITLLSNFRLQEQFILVFPHRNWTVMTHNNYLCDSTRHTAVRIDFYQQLVVGHLTLLPSRNKRIIVPGGGGLGGIVLFVAVPLKRLCSGPVRE
jgi:hypothetical protein